MYVCMYVCMCNVPQTLKTASGGGEQQRDAAGDMDVLRSLEEGPARSKGPCRMLQYFYSNKYLYGEFLFGEGEGERSNETRLGQYTWPLGQNKLGTPRISFFIGGGDIVSDIRKLYIVSQYQMGRLYGFRQVPLIRSQIFCGLRPVSNSSNDDISLLDLERCIWWNILVTSILCSFKPIDLFHRLSL